MRYAIPILGLAATVIVGCHSPSPARNQTATRTVAALPAVNPVLITTPGRSTSDDTWRIGIDQAGNSLDLSHHELLTGEGWSNSVWTTTSPDGWKTHAGWFVFIENESRVWAYDGDRLLILDVEKPGKGTLYSSGFPCAVPTEVFSRLPERKQKEIQAPQ
jgi:hypothetical protein